MYFAISLVIPKRITKISSFLVYSPRFEMYASHKEGTSRSQWQSGLRRRYASVLLLGL
jgi:hypothetical protein